MLLETKSLLQWLMLGSVINIFVIQPTYYLLLQLQK